MLSVYVDEGQTRLTLYFLSIFLSPGQLIDADIMINPHYRIIISQACNGIIPVLFYLLRYLPIPPYLSKAVWMLIGYLSFTMVNIIRILMVVYFVEGEGGRGNFYWSHDFFGNVLLMLWGLGLFVLCIKRSGRRVRNY